MSDKPWGAQVQCACGCGCTFTEPMRTGRPRQYIDDKHAQRAAMRAYRQRKRSGVQVLDANMHCRRTMANSAADAMDHLAYHTGYAKSGMRPPCVLGTKETANRCPAAFFKDVNCARRLCIGYATLLDDMLSLKVQGYRRRYTTADGHWLAAEPPARPAWEDPDVYR